MSLSKRIVKNARRFVKPIYLRVLFLTGLLRWARYRASQRGIVVITLHHVLSDDQYERDRVQPGMAMRGSTFQALLEYGARYCRWILPKEENAAFEQQTPRRPSLALTFDDGWRDNFEIAFPIAQKYKTPFTVFICPQMIDRDEAFWTETVDKLWWTAKNAGKTELLSQFSCGCAADNADSLIQKLKHSDPEERRKFIHQLQGVLQPWMNGSASNGNQLLRWPEVEHMAASGVAFGSHTNTHSILTDISSGAALEELTESRKAIDAKLNSCTWFAYPNGDWSPAVRKLVSESGYEAGFANSPGIWQKTSNRFSIPRVNVWEGCLVDRRGRFSRLALEYAIFWKAWRACRQSARHVR